MLPLTGRISRSWAKAGEAQRAAATRNSFVMLLFGRGVLFRGDLPGRFRIHRGRAADSHVLWETVFLAELAEERILSRQIMRHHTGGPVDLLNHRARVWRNLLVEREPVLGAADHRL